MWHRVKRALLVIALLALCTCEPRPVVAPTFEPSPFSLRVYPELVMVRTDMHVICQLPHDVEDGRYTIGIVDLTRSEGPIDRLQYEFYTRAPCEPFRVFCGYQEHGKKLQIITKDMTPVGECSARQTTTATNK